MKKINTFLNSFVCFAHYFACFAVNKKFILFFKFLLPVSFSLFTEVALCQEKNLSEIITTIAEQLADDENDPEAVSQYIDRLQELSENPVIVNSASEDEISRLFFLTDFQVKALVDYLHSSGLLLSVFELGNIPGFDKETAELLSPFITLENKLKIKSSTYSASWRNRLITNISYKPLSNDSSFLGSQIKMLTKYRFTSGKVSGGFTAEKDPGEKILYGNPPLPDFLSAHIAYNGTGIIRRIIVGDFSARFGQGTNINTAIRTGLSLSAPGYMAARNEIRPYTSTDENNFFRGVAGEFIIKNLGISVFCSGNLIDASTVSETDTSIEQVDNIYRAGLHTSSSQLLKKDVLKDISYGINLSYNFNSFRIGLTLSQDRLSMPMINKVNVPEAIFDFHGDIGSIYTFYYNSLIKKILLFGEVSVNESFKRAVIQGVTLRPSDRFSINFLFRDYNSGFSSFHGKGPSSASVNGNEQGIIGNFSFEAAKHLFISGGVDIQRYPWLKYRCSSPSHGLKQEIRVRYLPTEKLTIEALYNYRLTISDDKECNGIPQQKKIIARSIKGSTRYSISDNLIIGTRIDYKVSNPSGSRGMLLSQDVIFRFNSIPVSFWLRYSMFKTDDWDSRIYVYENDLLYSFSIPALSGEGSRSYIMVKWDIGDAAEIRLKYGITSISKSDINTENNEELKFQLKIMF